MASSSVFLALALCFTVLMISVEAKVRHHDFVLTEKNFTRLCSTKSAMVVNDTIPGPTIYVNKGDTLFVNVHNLGDYKVTLHWHGVKQPRNPWSDGPEYITQCAIMPGDNFTYEVIFSDEEGTLWWHAHNEWMRNTVHGAIVIYPEEGTTYPFAEPDGEEILVLSSWYTYDVNVVVEEDLEDATILPYSQAYTINGQTGDFVACGNGSAYRLQVEFGKTYLVRIINAAMGSELYLAVANHNLTVVGMDASYVKPFVSSYIVISPGNTIDVLLTANQTLGHYYIAAIQYIIQTNETTPDSFDNATATAIIEYIGDYTPPASPSFPYDTLPVYDDPTPAVHFITKFRSLHNQPVPKNITTRMFIAAATNDNSFNITDTLSASLNNISWQNPRVDVLQAYYYNISGYFSETFPDRPETFFDFVEEEKYTNNTNAIFATEVKMLEYGEEVEIVFQSVNLRDTAENHPMHLHGHSFYVVGVGDGNFDLDGEPVYNLVDPPYVNTATLPRSGWLVVRFYARNPGVWLWHCHFDRHLSYGMATVMIVKNGPTSETSVRKPPAYMPACGDSTPLIKLWKSDK